MTAREKVWVRALMEAARPFTGDAQMHRALLPTLEPHELRRAITIGARVSEILSLDDAVQVAQKEMGDD